MTLKPSTGDNLALKWTKSSHSTDDGPACVEVATTPGLVHVRDSKDVQGPRLAFAPDAWADFTAYAAGR